MRNFLHTLFWTFLVLGCQPMRTSITGGRGSASVSDTKNKEGDGDDDWGSYLPNPIGSNLDQGPILTNSSVFTEARKVLEARCLGCHASGSVGWNISFNASESVWVNSSPRGLIVPGDAAASRLVKFMIYSPGGIMPYVSSSGPSATSAQFPRDSYDSIVKWINALQPPPPVVSPPSSGLPKGRIEVGAEYQKLGDRRYVYRNMVDIFGPTIEAEARALIHNKILPFGGSCATGMGFVDDRGSVCLHSDSPVRLSAGSIGSNGYISPAHWDTVDLKAEDAPLNPDSSTVREAYRTYVCEKALFGKLYSSSFNGPVFFALQSVVNNQKLFEGQNPVTLNFATYPSEGSVPSSSELRAAYRLFFNNREPSPEVIAALSNVAQNAKDKIAAGSGGFPKRFEPWRYVLSVLCMAPDNQIQ